jgi:RimJ/RimL family protein N-acetyltransferase
MALVSSPTPPSTLDLPGAALHRLRVTDAPALHVAVRESLEHLAPWMPWATPGADTPRVQQEFAAAAESHWVTGEEHLWVLREQPDGPVLGAFGLHRRTGPTAVELGYWLHPAATGRGHARAATRVLATVGLALPGINRVEVHVDAANTRSAAVPRAAGLRLDRVDTRPPQTPAQLGRVQIWVTP